MSTQKSREALIAEIDSTSKKIKQLRTTPEPSEDEINQSISLLSSLKEELAALSGNQGKSKKEKFTLKTAKGTKDWHPSDMLLRQSIFGKITDVFQRHGGVTIDTPVFELKEILAGKYGEDSKLIYDLQDQGGELCSLRYDLTVPFARFMAMHAKEYPNIKRYHIAKVYRRDQPVMTKGRMREFYQCDFDIAGTYDPMVPDSEVLAIACETLESLGIETFTIKTNHRKILDGLFAVCGVPEDKIRTISSAVDKLDKMSWELVRKEMTEEKGLAPEAADLIGEYVKLKGGEELVEKLLQDEKLTANASAKQGLEEMQLLFTYLKCFQVESKISFDLSLARGLDYYTGIIYEAVTEGSAPPTQTGPKKKLKEGQVDESSVGVGSIAAGGRYDELVGMFSGNTKIPCVGISFGVERLFSLLSAKRKDENMKSKATDVFVMSLGDGLLKERMSICRELWKAGIKAEFAYKVKPKGQAQFGTIDKERIPYAVIVSPDEWSVGNVRVKEQLGKEEATGKGIEIKRTELVDWLKAKIDASE